MRKARRAGTTLSIGLALTIAGTAGSIGGCGQTDKAVPSACNVGDCASSAPAIDFSGGSASFTAHLKVLDPAGLPVAKTSVQVGKSKGMTDADGRITFKGLDAKGSEAIQVASKNAAPFFGKTDAFRSGQRTQSLTLAPLAFAEQVDLEASVVVQKDFGRLELEPHSIADKNGRRVTKAKLEVADLASTKQRRDELLPTLKAVDRKGGATVLKSLDAVAHVRLSDAAGATLNLAPTKAATLELKLPADSKVKVGGSLSMWSLDESSLTLHEEGTCVVTAQTGTGADERVCKGHVPHFSIWAVGEAGADAALQCINARVVSTVERCVDVEVERVFLESCDAAGENCHEALPHELTLSPADGVVPATCALLAESPTQRVSTIFNVDTSACAAGSPKSGRRLKRGDAESADAQPGGELLAAFASATSRVCTDTCQARELRIERVDLDAPLLMDHDDDGYLAGSELAAHLGDCDDGDASSYPGAAELFCSDKDRNCDGQAGALGDDAEFNASCALCTVEQAREIPGNLRDEDCDGSAQDRDGDGYAEPEDCNDFDETVAPGRSELPGNQTDEDCDGVAVDWDGDGALSSAHLYLASRLGLPPGDFGDCDDFDAQTSPLANVQREAGALAGYFGEGSRSAEYCGLFDGVGLPTSLLRAQLIDRNCDGKVTDADGDGFTAPSDLALGAALATDCDDLDPRVHTANADGLACAPLSLSNMSTCSAPPRTPACPTIGLSGSVLQTTCEEALDRGVGTGAGVCAFLGWSEADPLTLVPGSLWGPCDGAGPLPECPAGAQCGGPLPFTMPVSDYLERTFTSGAALSFKGMCFPKCTL